MSQGKTSVPSIDDNEDLEFTHDAFNILHFTEEETFNIYKIVSAVMNMGELVRELKDQRSLVEVLVQLIFLRFDRLLGPIIITYVTLKIIPSIIN